MVGLVGLCRGGVIGILVVWSSGAGPDGVVWRHRLGGGCLRVVAVGEPGCGVVSRQPLKIVSYFQNVTTITIGRIKTGWSILRQVWGLDGHEAHEKGKLDGVVQLPL